MKRMKHTRNGLMSFFMAAALIMAQMVGALLPVTVYAQDELLDEKEIVSEVTADEDSLLEEASPLEDEQDAISDDFAQDTEALVDEPGIPAAEESDDDPDPDGYVYVEETGYHFTFIILNDGFVNKKEVPNKLSSAGDINTAVNSVELNQILAMADENNIGYWELGINGHYKMYLTSDFKDMSTNAYYQFQPKMDYTLTALVSRQLTENIFVEAVPAVYYTGKPHVAYGDIKTSADEKKYSGDIDLYVYYQDEKGSFPLRPGTDYKTAHKNNIDATMKMRDDGTYESLNLADKKRPCIQITGINNYAGFSVDVYYDILPLNFGEKSYNFNDQPSGAWIDGIEKSYTLKNGKLTDKLDPKVKYLNNWNELKTITLKKGKDYDIRFYRYDETGKKWMLKNEVDESGRWLCTARGKGNFCGTVFGQYINGTDDVFNDGTQGSTLNPAVCEYTGSSVPNCQFKVEAGCRDLSKAKVTVGTKSVPYKHGKYYGAEDLKISVSLDGTKLDLGKDYRIVFDGVDYPYFKGKTTTSQGSYYDLDMDTAIFYDKVWMSNTYTVWVEAIAGNPNGYYGTLYSKVKVTVKGEMIKSGDFKLSSKSKIFDDTYSTGGTFAKKNNKLSDWSDDPGAYFSGYSTVVSSYYTEYDYLGALESKFKSASYDNPSSDLAFCGISQWMKYAGTGDRAIYPIGPGIDHSTMAKIKFKVTPLAMKDAIKKGMLKISATAGTYNAGGALPGEVKIIFNGYVNTFGMTHNNEEVLITDSAGDSVPVKLTISNNTKPGTGYLTIAAANDSAFKGSVSKAADFGINPLKVTASTIKVLKSSDYQTDYGKSTGKVSTATDPIGTLYATTQPVAVSKTGSLTGAKIDLYQSYYANQDDAYQGLASLKKLAANQYTLTPTLSSPGSYTIAVTEGSAGAEKTGLNFTGSTSLEGTYDIYDEVVTITSVTVVYGGKTYNLPADSKSLVTEYKGKQVVFESVPEIKVKSKSAGEVTITASDFTVTYGDNVTAGKSAGSLTVTLKKGTSGFKYGGSKEFKFNIEAAKKVIM